MTEEIVEINGSETTKHWESFTEKKYIDIEKVSYAMVGEERNERANEQKNEGTRDGKDLGTNELIDGWINTWKMKQRMNERRKETENRSVSKY